MCVNAECSRLGSARYTVFYSESYDAIDSGKRLQGGLVLKRKSLAFGKAGSISKLICQSSGYIINTKNFTMYE